ncbi:unnamed protein product [Lepidochelys kempii]
MPPTTPTLATEEPLARCLHLPFPLWRPPGHLAQPGRRGKWARYQGAQVRGRRTRQCQAGGGRARAPPRRPPSQRAPIGADTTGPCQPAPIGADTTGPCQPAPIGRRKPDPASQRRSGRRKPDPASQRRSGRTQPDPASQRRSGRRNRTLPASPDRTVPASADPTGHPGEDQTTPKLSPSALPPTPPVKQKPDFDTLMTPPAAPAPIARPLPVGMIVPLVIVAALLLALLPLLLHVRHRRRSGSSSFSAGRAGPSAWAGPVSLPEERGEGQAGDGGQQAGPGEARRPTLTTFFGKRHSRVSSVAMEDVAGVKGEGPLSEPLLATGGQGSEPGPQGAGEANGTVPLTPGPPSPPPDPPANGEFPLPPPHGAGSHAPCVSPTPNRLPRPRRPPCWNSQELPHSQHPAPSPQRPLLGEAGAGIAGSSRTASTLPPPHSAPCWARPGLE